MTHEFKDIVNQAEIANKSGIRSVLASVVALDGSSYRKPGVRMLILEDGKMIGAVSGGCVEKEILLQSETVFKTGASKIMTYDGRYRLGCEGVLYILIELFEPETAFKAAFYNCLKKRDTFSIHSYYNKKEGVFPQIGSWIKINDKLFSLQNNREEPEVNTSLALFKQQMPPCFKLVIIGAEHDAVQLCKYAALTGWEVTIVSGPSDSKSIVNFPGAVSFQAVSPEHMEVSSIDNQTAIVLMTHNFANDLRYLVQLKDTNPVYIGLLGPTKRREDLLSQFIEYCPDIDDAFLETVHGPAGIDIGSETPQEIAVSIVSEILAITRKRESISLSKKAGKIHS
ncbi:XdhC family protein [Flavivirga eckloniae]|uniref:XshC-Cox1-family protein n=1 Tax=Flavivirga eckloniae TaxID=1803846 RepID=A0A2K9PKY5_9FLAO|nr:XdhC/CoxI family protein [Flavivirga eckloniae]AUP77686.1 XshC-Cox1-family protein [Flavivirga eckloniae]